MRVKSTVGISAVPDKWVVVPALPETYSGKYMRRLLRALLCGEPLGDLAGLRNPECVDSLRNALAAQCMLPGAAAAAPVTTEALSDSATAEHVPAPVAPTATLEALLESGGLTKYLEGMEAEGYDDVDLWVQMDEASALEAMRDDVGMSEADARAFGVLLRAIAL